VLEDRFSAAEMSIALPKGRPAALAYVSEFVQQFEKIRDGSRGRSNGEAARSERRALAHRR